MEEKKVYVVINYEYDNVDDYLDDENLEEWKSSSATNSAYTDIVAAYHKARYLAKQEASCTARPYKLIVTTPSDVINTGKDMPEVAVHFTDDDSVSLWSVVEMVLDVKPTAKECEFEDSYPESKSVKDFDYCCNCKKWAGAIGGDAGYCRYCDTRLDDGQVVVGCLAFERKE